MKKMNRLLTLFGVLLITSAHLLFAEQNNSCKAQKAEKFQNPKLLTIDFSKTIRGLAVSNMLYTSDGGLLTVGTIATAPSHSILTKLSAQGDLEWEYSLTTQDTSLFINNMQEIVEITNGYEISGSIRLEKYLTLKGDRFRLQIDRKGKLISKWIGLIKNDSIPRNTDNPAVRNFYSGFNTVGTVNFDYTNQTVTPCLVGFDENGNLANEVVFTNNKISSIGIYTLLLFPTHGKGLAAVISCSGKNDADTTGFLQFWKFDKSGNYEWSKQLPEVYHYFGNRQFCSAIQTQDGGFAISSILESRNNPIDKKSPILLRKFDKNGKLLFSKSYSPMFHNTIRSIKETPSGDLILAGSGQDSVNSKAMYNKYLLIRTTPDGEMIWSDSFGETTSGNLILNLAVVDDHSFLLGGLNNSGVGINTTQAIVMKVRDGASGIEEQVASKDGIIISPNPSSTSFTISGNDNISSVKIMNSLGIMVNDQLLMVNGQFFVDVTDLAAGVYFVQVRTATGIITKPVVVTR